MRRFFRDHLTAPHGLRGSTYHPPAPHSSRWHGKKCPDLGVSPHLSHVSPHQAALQKYRFFAHAQGARRAPWACAHRHTGRERCSQGRANRRPWGAKRCAAPSRYCHFNFQVLKRSLVERHNATISKPLRFTNLFTPPLVANMRSGTKGGHGKTVRYGVW